MSNFRSNSRNESNSRSNADKSDEPPMSRLFIICSKECSEEDLRLAFISFGEIEDIWVVRDKHTGDSKGIAYIKFSKTSDAAKAQEEMDGKRIGNFDRALKVIVAANKSQGRQDNEPERYVRLFIVVPKNAAEDDIRAEFEKYGDVVSVSVVHDRQTGAGKGFAYVKFDSFFQAAIAYENCPARYRAVFAEPKVSRNRDTENRGGRDGNRDASNNRYNDYGNGNNNSNSNNGMSSFLKMQNSTDQITTTLDVICSNNVNQDQLWRLFDIVPGLDYCQITREDGPRTNEATVAYNTPEAAIYAKEKIHGLEYPIGERLIVKFSVINPRLDNSSMDVSFERNQNAMCSVNLPPAAPMASPDAPVARRLFIVLSSSIPQAILKNVFSSFGGLIDVYLLSNRNCGYVKYAREQSAQDAIDTLNGAEICSSKIKVMDAEEPSENNRKRVRRN